VLGYIVEHMSRNPEAKARMIAEIDSVFNGNTERAITLEDLEKLNYCEAIVNESECNLTAIMSKFCSKNFLFKPHFYTISLILSFYISNSLQYYFLALRLIPTGPLSFRINVEEDVIGGHVWKEGTQFALNYHGMTTNKSSWTDAKKFQPTLGSSLQVNERRSSRGRSAGGTALMSWQLAGGCILPALGALLVC